MTALQDKVASVFVDAGMAAQEVGTLTTAATTLADRLIAEGHADAVAELTAAFWAANDARLARRDRWDAHGTAYRAALDPGESEPPPPPPPPPPPDDPPPPPSDRVGR